MKLQLGRDGRSAKFAGIAAGLIALALSGSVAIAQSFYDVVGRNLTSTAKSVDRALSNAMGGQPERSAKRNKSRNARSAEAIPPLPTRQPKPWHKSSEQVPSQPSGGQLSIGEAGPVISSTAVSGVTSQTTDKKAATPLLPPSRPVPPNATSKRDLLADKSWPVTVQEAKAKAKARADEAAGKPADVWPELEVNIAKARCTHLLKQVNAEVEFEEPFKKGPCGDPAPVRLISLGSNPSVSISPPAVVNCNMVFSLHEWLQKDLQPLAKKHLGETITTIENMSSYSCRNAYARTSTRLSEHARANALDIRGFKTGKGNAARLLAHWGPTERDIEAYRVAQREEAERKAAEAKAKADAKAKAIAEAKKKNRTTAAAGETERDALKTANSGAAGGTSAAAADAGGSGGASGVRGSIIEGIPVPVRAFGYQPNRLGGPKASRKKDARKSRDGVRTKKARAVPMVDEADTRTAKAVFLREAHKKACRIFGTVLGPEANNAHRNHFHVDLAPRKRSNFCE